MANKNPRTDHLKDDQFPSEGKGMSNSKTKVMPVRADAEELKLIKEVKGDRSTNQWMNEAIKEKLERELGK